MGSGAGVRRLRPRREILLVVALAALGLPACSFLGATYGAPPLPASSPVRAEGMAPTDAWLRHHLLAGDPLAALAVLMEDSPLRPRDDLLRKLHLATALHYAGDFAASDSVFRSAEEHIEERVGTSVSATAGALLVSERASEYLPGPTERRMIHYYRILNSLALGDGSGAVVEARQLGLDLQTIAPESDAACDLAVLDHLVGLVFERHGERNDALVALRRAHRAGERCGGVDAAEDLARIAYAVGAPDLAPHEPDAAPGGSAEVLIVLERGFVPALRGADLSIPLYAEERDRLVNGGDHVLTDIAAALTERAAGGLRGDRYGASGDRLSPVVAHVVRLTWAQPIMHGAGVYPGVNLVLGEEELGTSSSGNPGAAAIREFNEAQPARLARAAGRSLVRYLATREVEQRMEERHGEAAFSLVATLTNLTLNVLDQPDVRSWSTLPARVEIVRRSVPAGEHSLSVRSVGRLDQLPPIIIEGGERAVVVHRLWSEPETPKGMAAR